MTLKPEKVLVQTPQPVKQSLPSLFGRHARLIYAIVVVLVAVAWYVGQKWPEPAKERATDALPIYTFESSESCPACVPETCPDCTWLSRFVGALDAEAESPLEIKDVLHRAYVESRFDNQAVSSTGDWGICQINAKSHPWVNVELLLESPEYAASMCLDAYRVAVKACGSRWECCYRYGVKGCAHKQEKQKPKECVEKDGVDAWRTFDGKCWVLDPEMNKGRKF